MMYSRELTGSGGRRVLLTGVARPPFVSSIIIRYSSTPAYNVGVKSCSSHLFSFLPYAVRRPLHTLKRRSRGSTLSAPAWGSCSARCGGGSKREGIQRGHGKGIKAWVGKQMSTN